MFLKIGNLSKDFLKDPIFSNLNLEMEKGELISLVGPSGCGKTTLLRCLAGLETVSNGTIILNDRDITFVKAEDRPVVMMFQQPLLFPHMTVLENITFGLRQQKVSKKERIERAYTMLEKVEMQSFQKHYPHQLSGGQQQRVSLARALIMNPSLLLLDEPFSSLDPSLRKTIREWVRKVIKLENVTALFVTHDRDEAMLMGDRIIIMKEGQFQQVGKPEEIYFKPINKHSAETLSDGISIKEGFVPSDKLMITTNKTGSANQVTIAATVTRCFYKYGLQFYELKLGISSEDIVIIHSNDNYKPGEQVFIMFERGSIHRFV
ncbi:ABC transporter ATP-binding protein [Bacillus sp. Marseille-P3661]|uniref:ABC transporter ATP-binding protein n=1 Tax=Bacillus sp. Marseille-P3661 TaxID=1936234 RepID=UPI000C852624|nr:ABC transporter ATP-binding protein [Bacillus sp. Marseille-P3661]